MKELGAWGAFYVFILKEYWARVTYNMQTNL